MPTEPRRNGRGNLVPAGRVASDLRRHNRAVVLGLIRGHRPVSRAALSRSGRLSMPAVLEIVGGLIAEGLVEEVGIGPSSGGRRPVLVDLVPHARCAVGLEVGSETLTAIVTDLTATPRHRLELPSGMAAGPEALAERVITALTQVCDNIPPGLGAVLGIGLAVPAPVMTSAGMVFSPASYPGWGKLHLGERVAAAFDVPVLLDNVANAAALGEHLFGAGQGVQNIFYTVLHRGVGGAAIIGGELYRGADGGAGEIGHTLIDPNGPPCGCGASGCLEALIGDVAIAARTARLARTGPLARLAPDRITPEAVIQAAEAGDPAALAVLEETGYYLGLGLANVVTLFDPELVILGGTTAAAGDLLLQSAHAVMRRRRLPGVAGVVPLVTGTLGEDAGAIGAAALVLGDLFEISIPATTP